jgi:uncharacterized protein YnzC (UPF0291/DUF896 family)
METEFDLADQMAEQRINYLEAMERAEGLDEEDAKELAELREFSNLATQAGI